MDADPRICLSLLYKNDPFYSLCLSDLMTAPQWVKNKFLKEQKNLTTTLKRLEHQKLTRLRQLNEEQNQFGLLMKRKLVPRVAIKTGSLMATERNSPSTLSSVNLSWLASSKISWKSLDPKVYAKQDAGLASIVTQASAAKDHRYQALDPYFPDNNQKSQCSSEWKLTRERSLPLLRHVMPSTRPLGSNWQRGKSSWQDVASLPNKSKPPASQWCKERRDVNIYHKSWGEVNQ